MAEKPTAEDVPRVRRRLVQSTLFPIKTSPQRLKQQQQQEEEQIEPKNKRPTKPKSCSNNKKVAVKGQETPNGRVDGKDSSAKPNLLADLSEGQNPQAEQQCSGSQEKNNGACSPKESTPDMKTPPRKTKRRASSTPKKKQLQTTPRKKTRNGHLQDTCPDQMLDCSAQSGNVVEVPDLRLEAKLQAEENARMFSGKKVHPFFSSCKVGKKTQETIDVDSWCPTQKKNISTDLGPVHVFEKVQSDVQDDMEPVNWGSYSFCERGFTGSNYDRQCEWSSFPGKLVDSLRFDDFVGLSTSRVDMPQNVVVHPDEVSLNASTLEQKCRPTLSSIMFAEEPIANSELIMDAAMLLQNRGDHGLGKTDSICVNLDTPRNSDSEWEDMFLHKRMMANYHRTDRHPENSLWTNKFFPEKASEVCGNSESVSFLSEWLRLWSEKGFCSRKNYTTGEGSLLQGDDRNSYGSDCDSENRDEANGLKNVILVTGPVGSGKSAAIYACAKEQGFHIIEVNASDWRTRALVMQRFEGGMESYWVQRTAETPVDSETKCIPTFAETVQGSANKVTEVINLSDEDDLQSSTAKFVCERNEVASVRSDTKPLILFEDVDAVLSEDHGLIGTIQKLSETAKRPIILTSNSCNLVLPNNMDRHELRFTKPSAKELFSHAKTVCAVEKVNIQPCLVERFIRYCEGDIRKAIMNLQFWCQGQEHRIERKSLRKYGPVFFDIGAGHRMLPKILPWGYPSDLSKVVEKEISRSLLAEESLKLTEFEEEEHNENTIQDPPIWRTPESGSIKAKKEAILRRHFPLQNGDEFSSPCELSNSTGSPVAFTRRNVRRKIDTVLFSDSEGDEGVKDRTPISGTSILGINDDDDILYQVNNAAPSYCAVPELYSDPVLEQLVISKKETRAESLNTISDPLPNGLCVGGLDDRIPLFGANHLEVINNHKILVEAGIAAPFFCAATEMCSAAPSYCSASEMFSIPVAEHLDIANKEVDETSFNPLSEPILDQTCNRGLNEEIVNSRANLLPNNINEIIFPADSSPSYCTPTKMCSALEPWQLVTSKEEINEGSFNPLSYPLNGTCKSVDTSCAPELSFVPETEINGGMFSTGNELIWPVNSTYQFPSMLERSPQGVKSFDVDMRAAHVEEVGDSNNDQVEAGHRGYQVTDECSRMEFNGTTDCKGKSRLPLLPESVKETWKRIRNFHSNLRQYVTPEERDASTVMKLAYEMSNLISVTDILLGDCQPVICDLLEPRMIPSEKSHSFSCYDDQLSMTSTIVQHGICLYTKKVASVRSDISSVNTTHLAREMLASSTGTMAFGNLVSQDKGAESSEMATTENVFSVKSDLDQNICSVVQSIVPTRSYLSTRGDSLHEYVSALGLISRTETSRLSGSKDKTRLRRGRVARNYLSTGAMMLSRDDISLLGQYSTY